MPVKVVESNLNVLQAAKIRIRNVFANGCKIYLSFSSGKDPPLLPSPASIMQTLSWHISRRSA